MPETTAGPPSGAAQPPAAPHADPLHPGQPLLPLDLCDVQPGRWLGAQRDAARSDLERVAAERDQALAEQETMQDRLAELARQRDAAAAERDRIRGEMERCVWIDPRRQSGTPCLGGTRISAYIIARLIADGTTAEQIRDMYPGVIDGHLRAVAAFMAERDTARRDGAADALEWAAGRHNQPDFSDFSTEERLREWAAEVRDGTRTIPTGGGDQP